MKKIPDIINRLWTVCGQMEVGALLTCGSGIIAGIFSASRNKVFFYECFFSGFIAELTNN